MRIWENITSNPWGWVFMAALALYSAFMTQKAMQRKIIKCSVVSTRLITNKQSKFKKLNILYDGKSIETLTVTKVTFWNSSIHTINSTDIIEIEPFSIMVENGEILDLSVLRGKNTSNQIEIDYIDIFTANINFEYLDFKEGGIVQIVHTGRENGIQISRKIKGGKIVISSNNTILIKKILLILLALPISISIVLLIYEAYNNDVFPVFINENMVSTIVTIVIFLILLGYSIMSVIIDDTNFIPINCYKGIKRNKGNKTEVNIMITESTETEDGSSCFEKQAESENDL